MSDFPAKGLRVVIVEDHNVLREELVHYLDQQGFAVEGVNCAHALDDLLAHHIADALVLDLNLPGEDGLSIARRLRRAMPDIGIIMLTARSAVAEKIAGYDSGADIYLPKPVSGEELVAVLRGMVRRLGRADAPRWRLERQSRRLGSPTGESLELSANEATLLSNLARAINGTLPTPELMLLLTDDKVEREKAWLEVSVSRLRKKLASIAPDPALPILKAVHGKGYQLCIAVELM